jgi:hypothetical protein
MSAAAFVAAMSLSLIACDDTSSSANNTEENPEISIINADSSNNEVPVAPVASVTPADSVKKSSSADSVLIRSCAKMAPDVLCADSMNTDGRYFDYGSCYFKCENNAWKGVTNVPSDDSLYKYSSVDGNAIWYLPKCTAENDGLVRRIWEKNPKYGSAWTYRCENGEWVPRGLWVTCDTMGVQVGDICRKKDVIGIFASGGGAYAPVGLYVYAGDGKWDDYDPRTEIAKECTETNEGDVASLVIDIIPSKRDTVWYKYEPWNMYDEIPGQKDTLSYECLNGEWSNFKITN